MTEKNELIELLIKMRDVCKNVKHPSLGGYACDVCPIKPACFKHVSADRDTSGGALEEFCNDAITNLIEDPHECPYRHSWVDITYGSTNQGEYSTCDLCDDKTYCEKDSCPLKLPYVWY